MSEQQTETKTVKVLMSKSVLEISITGTDLSEQERRAIIDPGHGVDHLMKLGRGLPYPDPVHWAKALAYLAERFATITDETLERMDPTQREALDKAVSEIGRIPKRFALIKQEAARGQRRRPGHR